MSDTLRETSDTWRTRFERLFYGTATVGERGQIVIPAQARREFGIETGDKLLVIGHPERRGVMICKIDGMREFMTDLLEGLRIVESQAATTTTEPAAVQRTEEE